MKKPTNSGKNWFQRIPKGEFASIRAKLERLTAKESFTALQVVDMLNLSGTQVIYNWVKIGKLKATHKTDEFGRQIMVFYANDIINCVNNAIFNKHKQNRQTQLQSIYEDQQTLLSILKTIQSDIKTLQTDVKALQTQIKTLPVSNTAKPTKTSQTQAQREIMKCTRTRFWLSKYNVSLDDIMKTTWWAALKTTAYVPYYDSSIEQFVGWDTLQDAVWSMINDPANEVDLKRYFADTPYKAEVDGKLEIPSTLPWWCGVAAIRFLNNRGLDVSRTDFSKVVPFKYEHGDHKWDETHNKWTTHFDAAEHALLTQTPHTTPTPQKTPEQIKAEHEASDERVRKLIEDSNGAPIDFDEFWKDEFKQ